PEDRGGAGPSVHALDAGDVPVLGANAEHDEHRSLERPAELGKGVAPERRVDDFVRVGGIVAAAEVVVGKALEAGLEARLPRRTEEAVRAVGDAQLALVA